MSAEKKQDGHKEGKEQRARIEGPIICPGHSRPVPDLAYSQVTDDGFFLISSCLDGKAMLREGQTGDWIGTFLGHKGAVWSARLNSNATRAVTGAADFTCKLWNAVSGDELHTFPHKHIVKSAVFSADSTQMYTGGQEKKLRIYDLNKPSAEPEVLLGHEASVSNIITVPDANMILTRGSEEPGIRIWDKRTLETVRTLPTDAGVTSMSITLDGTTLTTTAGNEVQFWDTSTFELVKKFDLGRPLNCVSYDPPSKRFVTGSSQELWVRGYDYTDGAELVCNKGHHGPVRSIAFNPAGTNYASGSEDGTIRIWDWPDQLKLGK